MAVESPDAASPFLFPNTVANAPASQAAIEVGIKGPNVTITQKDPAALNALFYARMLLADGRADALLVGAADEWNLVYHRAYERVRATRTQRRPGFVLGEGAALVLVEDETAARARGARIDALIAGLASRRRSSPPRSGTPSTRPASLLPGSGSSISRGTGRRSPMTPRARRSRTSSAIRPRVFRP